MLGARRAGLKKAIVVLSVLIVTAAALAVYVYAMAAVREKDRHDSDRVVFADFDKPGLASNFEGDSGCWEKDPDDRDQWVKASADNTIRRGKRGSSLKLEYSVDSPNDAVNGFWIQLGGLDASPYDHFEFWVRGSQDNPFPSEFKIEFKKIEKTADGHDETIKGSYIVKNVTSEWQKVLVPLNALNGIRDWRDLREFVITFEKRRLDAKSGLLYFDDLAFVKTGDPGPSIYDTVRHKKHKTARAISREEFARFLASRLNGFPKEVFVNKDFPADDREFLLEVARDTWKYFDDIVDREHQLPLDNINFSESSVMSENTIIGDYTNITNVGVYLMCLVSAYDLGFISKDEAVKRLLATLDSLENLEKYKDFPYNYYDITIFQRTSNFISFVDSGWLAAGLIVAGNAFTEELGQKCHNILDTMDFSFFYDKVEGHMYHGFYTNIGCYSEYHYGVLYTEPRAISFIAIGKGDVPAEHWFLLDRTFSDTWLWQTQMPKDRRERTCLGFKTMGGYYVYNDIKFVPSWGGSMFEALMPAMVIDEKGLAPSGLGLNDQRHALLQISYALDELKYPVFGMSPSAVPGGGYSEYGVRPLGIKGYKAGVITPHATFLALEFAPEECVRNLRIILEKYRAYGEYGFYDSIDINTGKVATSYLCLDQAMSFIALNNYLNDGAIRKRFHADPIAKSAEELLSAEDFFE